MNAGLKGFGLLAVLLAIAYMASPYYSTWKIMQAVQSGSAEQMRAYIDFPSVRASVNQQFDQAMEEAIEKDPMAAAFAGLAKMMLDEMTEQILQPEILAQAIRDGKLNKKSLQKAKLPGTDDAAPVNEAPSDDPISWSAFFDRPDRFRISVGELSVYLELRDWGWKLTAVGIEGLMEKGEKRTSPRELVADEIDYESLPPPVAATDLNRVRREIAEAFFIEQDWGDNLRVEGDFFYLPARQSIKASVNWLDAVDAKGNSVLGEFSEAQLEKRNKFGGFPRYRDGQWTDELPKKPGSGEVVSATGLCTIQVPTRIDQVSLDADLLDEMVVFEQAAVTLKSLRNGQASFSYYTPFDEPKVEPVVIVRNAAGQVLKIPGNTSMSSEEPVTNAQFKQPMYGTTKSLDVSGTPHSIEFYFPQAWKTVESRFTAIKAPQVSFGKFKTPITRTRYASPVEPFKFTPVEPDEFLNGVEVSLQTSTYDDERRLYLQLDLADKLEGNFFIPNGDALKISNAGVAVEAKTNRSKSTSWHQLSFSEPETGNHIEIDRIQGVVEVRYPAEVELIKVHQGELRDGIGLSQESLRFPKNGDVLPFNRAFGARSIVAYGSNDKQIRLLKDSSFWDKKGNRLIFWGAPKYVTVLVARKWHRLEIPVDLSLDDIKEEASQ